MRLQLARCPPGSSQQQTGAPPWSGRCHSGPHGAGRCRTAGCAAGLCPAASTISPCMPRLPKSLVMSSCRHQLLMVQWLRGLADEPSDARAALWSARTERGKAHLDGGDSLVQLLLRAAHKLARPLVPGGVPNEVQGREPGLAPGAHKDQHWLDGGVRLEATKSGSDHVHAPESTLLLMLAAIHTAIPHLADCHVPCDK